MTETATAAEKPSRARRVLAIVAALIVLGTTLTGAAFVLRPKPGPLDAVPEQSLLVVDANLQDLRASKLWEEVERFLRGSVPLDKLDAACGFATLSRLERGVLSIGEGEAGGVGLALTGSLAKEELLHCQTRLMIGAVGATKNQLAEASAHGGFRLTPLRLSDVDLVLGVGLARPLLLATPSWIERMADAADAPEKSSFARLFSSAPLLPAPHRELRARLEREAAGSPLLLSGTMKLPGERGRTIAIASQFLPTAALTERARQIGQPRGFGVALSSYDQGKRVTLRVVIESEDEATAAATKDVLLGTRLAYSQQMMLRIAGFGPLLDAIAVKTDGAWVIASLDDTAEAFAGYLAKAGALRGKP